MKKYLKKINCAALISAIYFSIVWMAYIYLNLTSSVKLTLMLTLFTGITSYFVLGWVIGKLRKIEDLRVHELPRKKRTIIFFIAFVVVFLLQLVWILAYFPGSFSPDSISQYGQALSGSYSDWHPVWHTILFFTVPLRLFGNPAAIVVMQTIYLAAILAYMAVAIAEIWNIQAAILSIAFIMLNPFVCYVMLFPWKDVAFALGGLLCLTMSVKLMLKKQQTYTIWKLIILGILFSWTTLFRHNAVLFTVPLLVVLLLHIEKKAWLKVFVSFAVSMFIITIPFYNAIGVDKPGNRVVEVSGLPLTVLGNVVKETPSALDEELSEFAYSIATQEEWEENYICGNFNSIKWTSADTTAVEDKGYVGMLQVMAKCFTLSPRASFEAFFALTDIVYGFETGAEQEAGAFISDNDYGIAYTNVKNEICTTLVTTYASFINGTMFIYIRTCGVVLFVLLVAILSRLKFNSWESWKKSFISIPILCYDFGTMLLLTGPDSRLFLITFLVAPLMIVYALSTEGTKASV